MPESPPTQTPPQDPEDNFNDKQPDNMDPAPQAEWHLPLVTR